MTVQHEREERVDVLIVTAVKEEWEAVRRVSRSASSAPRHSSGSAATASAPLCRPT